MAEGRHSHIALITPRRLATAAAAVLFCVASNCDDVPIYPRDTEWHRVARYPDNTIFQTLVEAPDGSVYAAGCVFDITYSWYPVVYRYDGLAFEEVYRDPHEYGEFNDVKMLGDTIWAAGSGALTGPVMQPLLIKASEGEWREIDFPPGLNDEFRDVFPFGPDSCWVGGWNNVLIYDRGHWDKKLRKTSPGRLFASGPDEAFVYVCKRKTENPAVFVTNDGGDTWVEENIDLGSGLYRFDTDTLWVAMGGAGGKLFLAVILMPYKQPGAKERLRYYAILGREPAPPGEGVYEIEMLTPEGTAGFNYLSPLSGGMAFRSSTEGFLVNIDTCIAYDDGVWVPEELDSPGPWGVIFFEAVTAGRSNYWAAVAEGEGWPRKYEYYLYSTE